MVVVGALPDVGHDTLRRVVGVLVVWRRRRACGYAGAKSTPRCARGTQLPSGLVGTVLTAGVVVAGVLVLVLVLRL